MLGKSSAIRHQARKQSPSIISLWAPRVETLVRPEFIICRFFAEGVPRDPLQAVLRGQARHICL